MKKLFTILILFFALKSIGQIYQPNAAYGTQMKRLKVDSTLHIPTFSGIPNLMRSSINNQAAIAFDSANNIFYVYNPKTGIWGTISGGGGGGGSVTVMMLQYTASQGQTVFTTPLAISDINKVWAVRNGCELQVTANTATTVLLPVPCDANDTIIIKQIF